MCVLQQEFSVEVDRLKEEIRSPSISLAQNHEIVPTFLLTALYFSPEKPYICPIFCEF